MAKQTLTDRLLTSEGRRAAALGLMTGGGISMTLYAAAALWLVSAVPAYVFYLGLAAHLSILVVLTGFAGLLVKRMLKANFGAAGFEIDDTPDTPPTVTTTTTTETNLEGTV